MKKITSIIAITTLVLSLSSCNGNINKKIPLETLPPVVQDNGKEPVDTSQDITDTNIPSSTPVKESEDTQTPVIDTESLSISNEKISDWMPGRNKEHRVPVLSSKFKNLLDKYGGYFLGDTSSKVIYLTFDEGYENGYSSKILDILKANNIKAAFFVTKPYIKSSPALVKRMVEEGHLVCNHSSTHPSMPDVSDDKVIKELTDTAQYFKEITGVDMPKFFRPPMGEWSERTLSITNSLGYKTILWSMAHKDWDPNLQPGKEASYNFVDTYYHNGAILLLHAVSKSNTDALDSIIKNLESNGYRFASLDELK